MLKVTGTAWKVSQYGVFSGPYFPTFGLNTERYFVSLRIQCEWGKIRTRKNSVLGHFSRSVVWYFNTRTKIWFWNFEILINICCITTMNIILNYLLENERVGSYLGTRWWIPLRTSLISYHGTGIQDMYIECEMKFQIPLRSVP